MRSVLEVVKSSTEYLGRHGVESPRLNAECLVAHVLGKKQRIDLYLEFDRPLGSAELDPLRELMRRRAKGEPLQHLLGTVEFYGRVFAVDKRALIPRPETEELIALILKLELPAEARCVDVGVGSGAIAVTLAAERPGFVVTGVDVSPLALKLARENAAGVSLSLVASDLLQNVDGPFDLVVANLPYIASGDIATLDREVQHDPRLALDGGPDGLRLIERCIGEAKGKLAPGGYVALEIGHDQARAVETMLQAAGFREPRTERDAQGVERFVLGRV